jgi:hypothetical protein
MPSNVISGSGGGGSGLTNPMDASGDIIVGGTSGAPAKLAKGSDGQFLKLASGTPSWAAETGLGDTLSNATTVDDTIARYNGTNNKTIQGSGIKVDDSWNMTGANSISTKTSPVYNVKEWGLVGNGSTDNGAAWITLCTAVVAANGGTIYFPAGNYKFLSTFDFNRQKNVSIIGDGRFLSNLDFSGAAIEGLYLVGGGGYVKDLSVKTRVNQWALWVSPSSGDITDTYNPVCRVENIKIYEGQLFLQGYYIAACNIQCYQVTSAYVGIGARLDVSNSTVDGVWCEGYNQGITGNSQTSILTNLNARFCATNSIAIAVSYCDCFNWNSQYGAGMSLSGSHNRGYGIFELCTPVGGDVYAIFDELVNYYVGTDYTGHITNIKCVTLDNTSTDGGAIYFNDGTTSFLKSDPTGADLQIGGFTTTTVPNGHILRPANYGASGTAITLDSSLTLYTVNGLSLTGYYGGVQVLAPFLFPQVDNYTDIGKPAARFKNIYSAGSQTVGRIDASLNQAIAVANEARTDVLGHLADGTIRHQAAQANSIGAACTTLATLKTLCGQIAVAFEAHNDDAILASGWAYHNAQITTYALASTTTPSTLQDCFDMLVDIRSKFNDHEPIITGHMAQVGGVFTIAGLVREYSTLPTDYLIGVSNTGSATTIWLSTADVASGRTIIVKDESGDANTNNITVATQASENIDGAATYVINANYESVMIYSDGTNWFVSSGMNE